MRRLQPASRELGIGVAREEGDRDVSRPRIGLQPPAERDAVDPRHPDVEHDHIGMPFRDPPGCLRRVLGFFDLDVGQLEARAQERTEVLVIVDDQESNGRRTIHPLRGEVDARVVGVIRTPKPGEHCGAPFSYLARRRRARKLSCSAEDPPFELGRRPQPSTCLEGSDPVRVVELSSRKCVQPSRCLKGSDPLGP